MTEGLRVRAYFDKRGYDKKLGGGGCRLAPTVGFAADMERRDFDL